MRKILILLILFAAAYGVFRQSHIKAWEKGKQAYVIFAKGSPGKAICYAWHPLTCMSAALTGMRLHIDPHE